MPRFSRMEVFSEILRIGLVPSFYHPDLEVAGRVVAACRAGGARAIEFTHHGSTSIQVFSDLVKHFVEDDPNAILGVGKIPDPATAALYLGNGADFVISSTLDPELARICNRHKVAYCPGCASAPSIMQAEELGAEIVSVFPGDSVVDADFVRSILSRSPATSIMPVGKVDATRESVAAWLEAGAAALGIGSPLIGQELLAAGDFKAIESRTAQVLSWIREARGERVFQGIEHTGLYPREGVSAEDLVAWYTRVFGFRSEDIGPSIFVAGSGAGRIEVMKAPVTDRSHVAVRVADFEQAVAELQAKGIRVEMPKIKPKLKAVFLSEPDPAGNFVHLLWLR